MKYTRFKEKLSLSCEPYRSFHWANCSSGSNNNNKNKKKPNTKAKKATTATRVVIRLRRTQRGAAEAAAKLRRCRCRQPSGSWNRSSCCGTKRGSLASGIGTADSDSFRLAKGKVRAERSDLPLAVFAAWQLPLAICHLPLLATYHLPHTIACLESKSKCE